MTIRTLAIIPLLAIMLTACGGGKSSDNSAANSATDTSGSGAMSSAAGDNTKPPNCGAVKAVWVNLNTKVYHEPGDQYYGKTSHGEYLCPSAAKAQGFRPAGGGMTSSGKHHSK